MEILNIYPNPERSEWAALTERCTRREEDITRQVASRGATAKRSKSPPMSAARPQRSFPKR